ncbi:integrase arm-type DNA-binding domain-containing protein [Novosphingobium sp. BW1]|uniref:tyrosine-type recombinase/integrase n=1 Tax=Novosphingobium sp. BW1 TaxID=2592621 RepID=UPI0011DEF5C5|nr:integrase arm-type DNA-binding domain-containing protein [Novosphingobium sp. BW1]TYC93906.1 tyrosine-type recombinase/integrase [Novosphingobium sp. BW1]
MALNDVAIRALKPQNRSYMVADEKGLCIEVAVSGSKLWRFRYRFAGKPRKLALGSYPEVSLKEARRLRDEARSAVRGGIDPGVERKNAKLTARFNAANTFGAVADEYIEHKLVKEGRAAVTVEKAKWLLLQMKPIWDQPLIEIKPAEVFGVLRRLEGQRKHETAKRCRSFTSRVFRYAAATGRAESDPAAMLSGQLIAPKVKHHAAILEPGKLGELLRSIDTFEGAPITRLALQIAPHVMARPGELRKATWDEFDLDTKIWRIKPERMKMRRPHAIPLSERVLAYLRELQQFSGPEGYVFPAFHTTRRPMSENTMNQAFRRMGYTSDEVTAHGLRTTASTLLNESGKWHPDAIERALAHGDSDAVRGIYNRGHYWDARVKMMTWWSDYLDRLRIGGEVVEIENSSKREASS